MLGDHMVLGGNGGGLFVADQQITKGGDHGNLITN